MAGGKETPRQKMIGMMYLVLTALLALNVSKSILDAFVNIEENIQIGNISEHQRGIAQIEAVSIKAAEKDSTGAYTSPKAGVILESMKEIDKLAAEKVQFVDKVKLIILQSIQEDLDPKAEKPIIILDKGLNQAIDIKDTKNPRLTKSDDFVKPIRMNLRNVSKKDAYDEQMLVMGINESIESPNKAAEGFKVWDQMLDYRAKLPALLVNAINEVSKLDDTTGKGKEMVFKDPKINAFKDIFDLGKKIDGSLKDLTAKDENLSGMVKRIYQGLTKNEKIPDPNGETGPLHWIGMTFDHAPAVAALAALSGLQSEILTARADALTYLAEQVGGGSYSFNAVEGRAFAPPSAGANAKVRMDVMMVAFDTEKQPIVTPDQGRVVERGGGKAIVEFDAPSQGTMELTGTVAIKDKNGNMKSQRYSTEITVVSKGASVALPELSVMYTDWDNKVIAQTSAATSDFTTSANATKRGTMTYKGKTVTKVRVRNPGSIVRITPTGKDVDGNTVSGFDTYEYTVKPFPTPRILNESLSRTSNSRVKVGLGQDSPLGSVTFRVISGEITIGSDIVRFTGDVVPSSLLRRAAPGRDVALFLRCQRNGSSQTVRIKGVMKVTQ